MVVIFTSCEEVFGHVIALDINLDIGNIDWESQNLVWRVVRSSVWMWSIAEQAGGE